MALKHGRNCTSQTQGKYRCFIASDKGKPDDLFSPRDKRERNKIGEEGGRGGVREGTVDGYILKSRDKSFFARFKKIYQKLKQHAPIQLKVSAQC